MPTAGQAWKRPTRAWNMLSKTQRALLPGAMGRMCRYCITTGAHVVHISHHTVCSTRRYLARDTQAHFCCVYSFLGETLASCARGQRGPLGDQWAYHPV